MSQNHLLDSLAEQQRYESMGIPRDLATVFIGIHNIVKSNKSELEAYVDSNFVKIQDLDAKVSEIIKSKSLINKVLKLLKKFWILVVSMVGIILTTIITKYSEDIYVAFKFW